MMVVPPATRLPEIWAIPGRREERKEGRMEEKAGRKDGYEGMR